MEALPTHPPSSLLPKPFISTNTNPLHLLKPPPPTSNTNNPSSLPPLSTNYLLTKSNQPLSLTSSKLLSQLPLLTTFSPPPKQPPLQTHPKAATGYAAALLDVAICDGADLGAVARDARRVRRVVGLVMGDERVEKKGEVVRSVVEGGRGSSCYGKLVVLVRMLVDRGKVGMVGEVMEEFGRLWEELCGVDRVVTVNTKNKGSLVF